MVYTHIHIGIKQKVRETLPTSRLMGFILAHRIYMTTVFRNVVYIVLLDIWVFLIHMYVCNMKVVVLVGGTWCH